MNIPKKTLLPNGFQDLIAPQAGQAHQILTDIIDTFTQFDYQLVEPPLLEYEESLLNAPDALKSQDIFRFIDPVSHQTMGLRGDITLQVVRMAKDHLAQQPRPLRLAYYGHVLRIATTDLRPQRQFMQLGLEQVGGGIQAEIEVIQVALEALQKISISDICLDFVLPTLLRRFLDILPENCHKMIAARNIGSIRQQIHDGIIDPSIGEVLEFLLLLPPDPDAALNELNCNSTFAENHDIFEQLTQLIEAIRVSHPKTKISLDVIEQHGFGYKTGIGFNLFAKGQNTSLGRGGRYQAGHETACGVSLNLSNLLGRVEINTIQKILAIPYKTDFETIRRLQSQGWTTVFSSHPSTKTRADHCLVDGEVLPVSSSQSIKEH